MSANRIIRLDLTRQQIHQLLDGVDEGVVVLGRNFDGRFRLEPWRLSGDLNEALNGKIARMTQFNSQRAEETRIWIRMISEHEYVDRIARDPSSSDKAQLRAQIAQQQHLDEREAERERVRNALAHDAAAQEQLKALATQQGVSVSSLVLSC